MIIAKTKRLIISEFKVEDAPFFHQLLNTPKWIAYIGDRHVNTIEDAKKYLLDKIIPAYNKQGFGFYKLALKDNGLAIGTAGLVTRPRLDFPDIGFALLPEFESKGFGYESSVAILELAKSKFNLKKVLGITLEHNKNSIKLLEKLGLEFEKRIKPFEDDEELLLFAKDLS
ncbi:RimJ/RimL family protein N-acetyltransferase [Hanstruepera neustonica]|uniref:RimJ/RimL family protein N-acetyltransferase n=1 Tax=Hanstruepera neustonica TaxID=1445657 RepID=A0A2K1E560_9FLAO|nr:GNAT family N-acetyltransferase [Hanstruepera neustonica]PNQ75422.1 RimJ/RimL family protein N-acetyltransferase [Hanstruepera neustonica]